MGSIKKNFLGCLVATVFCMVGIANAQNIRVEPPNWWVGFKNTNLQLLVHANNIGNTTVTVEYPGVNIVSTQKAKSPNYLFIDLNIAPQTVAGSFNLVFTPPKGKKITYSYQLKKREKPAEDFNGFNSSDAIYLITPDRFANGNLQNDINKNLLEKTIDRKNDYARHGGDIRGIIDHLEYISELGFTAVWPCPMLINDMPQASYHGYAITDFYQVDPRFGSLEEYRELADKTREKGMKLIMDQVANHCGVEHWWMKDLPFDDWVNQQKAYESKAGLNNSNHRRTTNQDSYASEADRKGNNEGWFVPSMPDLNQRNPFMATYLIQNSIWWVETLGLGGIRQDTYPYPDKTFMAQWAGAIMAEYPNFSIVGEEWSYNPLLIAYWQQGNPNKDGYKSNLKSTMDFAMQRAVVEGLNEEEQWDKGLVKLYEGLANDFAYASPKDIMVFPDNHDMSRIFTQMRGDVPNTKAALGYFLTMPRIPQVYYGTEILMDDFANPGDHGLIRTDFPGGWPGDTVNAFTGTGLTEAQKNMQQFLKKILNYRKKSEAIQNGKTVHFAPENGTYFLFRVSGNETVVHIINKNKNPQKINLSRFEEMGLKGKTLKNIISGDILVWGNELELTERGSLLLTTKTE